MKVIFSLITLAVVCCAQAQPGGQGIGGGLGGWGIGDLPPRPVPTFPEFTIPPNTGYPTRRWRPWNREETASPPFPSFPINGPITVDPVDIPIVGGIQNATVITQEHRDLASFAAREIGSEYTLTEVKEVREQLVAGMVYRIKVVIAKNVKLVQTTLECDVKVYHIVWLSQKTLEEFSCKRLTN